VICYGLSACLALLVIRKLATPSTPPVHPPTKPSIVATVCARYEPSSPTQLQLAP
jgi:hypothetical protein